MIVVVFQYFAIGQFWCSEHVWFTYFGDGTSTSTIGKHGNRQILVYPMFRLGKSVFTAKLHLFTSQLSVLHQRYPKVHFPAKWFPLKTTTKCITYGGKVSAFDIVKTHSQIQISEF